MKNRVKISAAFLLALALVAAPVAATAAPVADPPALGGSSNSVRKNMLNVLGSVLKAATPKKWQREQLANQNRYNQAWETLDAMHGYNSADPAWLTTPPSTAGEYLLHRAELESTGSFTKPDGTKVKGSGPIGSSTTFPATKTAKFMKGAGAAIAVVTGAEIGFSVGKAVSSAFGLDVNGGICGQNPGDPGSAMLGFATGTDCEGYWDMIESYVVNADVDKLARGGQCDKFSSGQQYSVSSTYDWRTAAPVCRTYIVVAGFDRVVDPNGVAGSLWLDSVVESSSGVFDVTFKDEYYRPPTGTSPTGGSVSFSCFSATTGRATGYSVIGVLPSPTEWTGTYSHGRWIDGTDLQANYLGVTHVGQGVWRFSCPSGHRALVLVRPNPNWSSATPGRSGDVVMWSQTTGMVPADMTADPERTLKCVITFSDSTTAERQTSPYRESSRTLPPVTCPGTGSKIPVQYDVYEHMVIDGTDTLLYSEEVTDEYQDMAEDHPECLTGACALDLLIKATPSTAERSCFDHPDVCADWFTQTDKNDVYQCRYGTQDVPLNECYVYSGTFKTERIIIGAPYSDPETGEWSGGQSSPAEAGGRMQAEIQDPEAARKCLETGWAQANPVEWVLVPIQCALEWAFVPRSTVIELHGAEISTSWEATAPGYIAGQFAEWSLPLAGSGCGGFAIEIGGLSKTFADACTGWAVQWAPTIKTVLTGLAVLFGSLGVVAMFSGTIGMRGPAEH